MAKGKKSASKVSFTLGIVDAFTCPSNKAEAFLWDEKARGLGLRAYRDGGVFYLFQSKLNGRTVRSRIGSRKAWDIDKARDEARRQQVLIDQGIDPRVDRAEKDHGREQARRAQQLAAVTVGEAWKKYVEACSAGWGEAHRKDHAQAVQVPGLVRKRSRQLTKEGTIYPLLSLRFVDLSPGVLSRWMEKQTKARPTKAALGFRLYRAFLNWCADQPEYRSAVNPDLLLTKQVRKQVARSNAKKDALEREMLTGWFAAVGVKTDLVTAAYFETILLTGARPGEVVTLRWEDIDFRWCRISIRDKVEGKRDIPLTPYLAQRLGALPRRNAWVFSSITSRSGHLEDVHDAHKRALQWAGLPHVTLHGLRRSFGTLSEWVGCPVGVVAQIQGHKPSAIAEKHYRVRPLDLLRMWHTKIEAWILEQAEISQPVVENMASLRVVAG